MIKLRSARISRGWSLEYVALQIGVTKTAIHDIEMGKRMGSIKTWDALEDLFRIPQRQLREVHGTSHPNNTKTPDGNRTDK